MARPRLAAPAFASGRRFCQFCCGARGAAAFVRLMHAQSFAMMSHGVVARRFWVVDCRPRVGVPQFWCKSITDAAHNAWARSPPQTQSHVCGVQRAQSKSKQTTRMVCRGRRSTTASGTIWSRPHSSKPAQASHHTTSILSSPRAATSRTWEHREGMICHSTRQNSGATSPLSSPLAATSSATPRAATSLHTLRPGARARTPSHAPRAGIPSHILMPGARAGTPSHAPRVLRSGASAGSG